jgi:hypothetical protein
MKQISVALTTPQCVAYQKTVTRRLGWLDLKPAEILQLVEKGQGLRKGEHVKKIHQVQVIGTRTERLDKLTANPHYGKLEMIREGFPDMTPDEFVSMFCRTHHCVPSDMVNRIDWRYYLKPGDQNGILRVPPSVVLCPDCKLPLTIAPDGWRLLHDGTMECDSFTSWCDSEPDIEEEAKYAEFEDNHSNSLTHPYIYWMPVESKIEKWLNETFRFEIGGAETVDETKWDRIDFTESHSW